MALPKPSCQLGYTTEDLEQILGDRLQEFYGWMDGQTVGICDGRDYNHQTQEYYETKCGPHGSAYYQWDVVRFIDGRPIVD